jgi:hypothetical protein
MPIQDDERRKEIIANWPPFLRNILKRVPGSDKMARLLDFVPWEPGHRETILEMLPKQSVCAEVGVHRGDFSARILQIVNPKELHLMDPWKYETSSDYKEAMYGGAAKGGQQEMDERCQLVRQRFASEIKSGQITIHRDFSSNVLSKFADGYFDWIYIDGNHLYEFVKQDLELSLKKTKPKGYITGDDYQSGGWWRGGVKKAVDEFVREKPVELVTISNGKFVLRKNQHGVK